MMHCSRPPQSNTNSMRMAPRNTNCAEVRHVELTSSRSCWIRIRACPHLPRCRASWLRRQVRRDLLAKGGQHLGFVQACQEPAPVGSPRYVGGFSSRFALTKLRTEMCARAAGLMHWLLMFVASLGFLNAASMAFQLQQQARVNMRHRTADCDPSGPLGFLSSGSETTYATSQRAIAKGTWPAVQGRLTIWLCVCCSHPSRLGVVGFSGFSGFRRSGTSMCLVCPRLGLQFLQSSASTPGCALCLRRVLSELNWTRETRDTQNWHSGSEASLLLPVRHGFFGLEPDGVRQRHSLHSVQNSPSIEHGPRPAPDARAGAGPCPGLRPLCCGTARAAGLTQNQGRSKN